MIIDCFRGQELVFAELHNSTRINTLCINDVIGNSRQSGFIYKKGARTVASKGEDKTHLRYQGSQKCFNNKLRTKLMSIVSPSYAI